MTGLPRAAARRAAFLDRDGTIIRDASYIADPKRVELLPDAARAIRRLNEAGVFVIVVTNQSGIARGLITPADYQTVKARLEELLGAHGARVDATYMCPHHPDITGPCDCRKPGVRLYQQAIDEYRVDPAASAFIGDRWRDVAPASALGGTPILVAAASTPDDERSRALDAGIRVVHTLDEAVSAFLGPR